ncbi:MAG: preprotein translocase subunit YajC [Lachnospiraceae bacterium]|nr:preprotein translocase subunit YajC [Lachnospiraceae bacterium]
MQFSLLILSYALALFAILYFFVIKPGQKKNAQMRMMHDSIKVGDKVNTIGGVIGTVIWRDTDTVKLLLDEESGTTATFVVYAIQQIIKEA